MNLYHDNSSEVCEFYNWASAWKTRGVKNSGRLDWNGTKHLNNEFLGHLVISFRWVLQTRQVWQWEGNSCYPRPITENRQRGADCLTGGCGLDCVLTTAALITQVSGTEILLLIWILFPTPFPEYWHPWHDMICSNAFSNKPRLKADLSGEYWTLLWCSREKEYSKS